MLIHIVDGIERSFVIRWSDNNDLQGVHEWLQEEDVLEVHGNFLANWNLTQQCHEEGSLLVLIDATEDIPVAYQWGQLLSPGILQVRNGWRGKGLGLLMVEHCVWLALTQDEMILQVKCKPSSSIQFWEKMGFLIVQGEFGRNATGFRVLSKCRVPCDYIPTRSYALFNARAVVRALIDSWNDAEEPQS